VDQEQNPSSGDITRLISAWQRGEPHAEDALYTALYKRLHALAIQRLRYQQRTDSLSATALMHEAYLKLRQSETIKITDSEHFMRLVARVMQHIQVDHARRRQAARHGGGLARVDWDDCIVGSDHDADEILEVSEALKSLQRKSPRLAQIARLHFFAGHTFIEIGKIMNLSDRQVKRLYDEAKTRLKDKLDADGKREETDGPDSPGDAPPEP